MARDGFFRLQCILSILLLSINIIVCSAQDEDRKVYIVYMGSLPTGTLGTYSPTSHHLSLLHDVVGETSSASASLIRSYTRSFNGFVAKLTQKEADKLASKKEVFSVFPRQNLRVLTTKSWDFIGLPKTAKRKPAVESNTIIGVIDSGADPTSESFSDEGFGAPPRKWKGSCIGGTDFTCNNKLIGARYYVSGDGSAGDGSGHGTHTASTAAGNAVDGASFYGLANGTARGGVPSARIAVYKVCDSSGNCATDEILAAFDDAIADGVDIITVSLGGTSASPFDADTIAIGAFHAMAKGILVTHAAGNSGPEARTLSSVAPWLFTVAATSIDRKFISKLVLGDGTVLTGLTINGFPSLRTDSPLVFGEQITSTCDEDSARVCIGECLDMQKVAGKIVICNSTKAPPGIAAYNVKGIILRSPYPDVAFPHELPSVALDASIFEELASYLSSTSNPEGRILKGETAPNRDSPTVATFSSRGPNVITPDIMKPDVSAPGVNILAAYPSKLPPTRGDGDDRSVKYNLLSGTSMACPHAAGAAAYVKTFHPDWSPSFIKSALMTTASKVHNGEATGYEFSYGSGQINPVKALDPGLVYEITKADYVNLLCSLGFDVRSIDSKSTCPRSPKNITEAELNYPSLTFKVPASESFKLSLSRTVTNVGPRNSTYKAKVVSSSSIEISVIPAVLSFKSASEKKSFTVKISGRELASGTQLSEEIVWSDGLHIVRSPIIVYTE